MSDKPGNVRKSRRRVLSYIGGGRDGLRGKPTYIGNSPGTFGKINGLANVSEGFGTFKRLGTEPKPVRNSTHGDERAAHCADCIADVKGIFVCIEVFLYARVTPAEILEEPIGRVE